MLNYPRVDLCVQANNTLAHPLKHYKLVYLGCRSVRIHTDVTFPFSSESLVAELKKKVSISPGVVGSGLKRVENKNKKNSFFFFREL